MEPHASWILVWRNFKNSCKGFVSQSKPSIQKDQFKRWNLSWQIGLLFLTLRHLSDTSTYLMFQKLILPNLPWILSNAIRLRESDVGGVEVDQRCFGAWDSVGVIYWGTSPRCQTNNKLCSCFCNPYPTLGGTGIHANGCAFFYFIIFINYTTVNLAVTMNLCVCWGLANGFECVRVYKYFDHKRYCGRAIWFHNH